MKQAEAKFGFSGSRFALNEFDLVSIRVFDECDDRLAMLHRARFAADLTAALTHFLASLVRVIHLHCDVPESVTHVVGLCVPVMRKLEDGCPVLIVVSDESIGETAIGIVRFAQEA